MVGGFRSTGFAFFSGRDFRVVASWARCTSACAHYSDWEETK